MSATAQQQSPIDQQAASIAATGQQAASVAAIEVEAVQRAVREAPKIFFPRASTSECVWNLNYFDKVAVNEYTDQIGVATATW